MTREERAREALLKAVAPSEDGWIECRPDWIIDHMVAFADAEAAAMRERAAEVADAYSEVNFEAAGDSILLDPVISGRGVSDANIAESEKQRLSGMIHTSQAHAGNHIAAAIRSLPATGEVGRG